MRTNIAIASASTTMMRVSDQLDLDALVPMLIQEAPLRRRAILAGAHFVSADRYSEFANCPQ
jgi:hypothetical protein